MSGNHRKGSDIGVGKSMKKNAQKNANKFIS